MRATALVLIVLAGSPHGPAASAQDASGSPPETTWFDYRVEPLVDLYHYVREQVTRDGEPDAPAELAVAVAAARKLREKLGSMTLAWSVLDRHLPASRTAAELENAFAGLPAKVRAFGGETIEIRDDAIAFADALAAVEPAYRETLWPRHEAAIRDARERIEERFRPQERECVRYMVESLGMEDPRDVVPVYLVFRSTWPEAYTIERPGGGGLVFVAVAREEHAGTLLFETILHEATHALDLRTSEDAGVLKQIRDRLEAAGMSPRDRDFRNVPHTIMFVQAGETVRRLVSAEHEHYGVASRYYERSGRIAEVERRVWIEYLDGKLTRDEAVAAIVRELAPDPPAQADDETGLAAVEERLYATVGRVVFANGRDARDIPFEVYRDLAEAHPAHPADVGEVAFDYTRDRLVFWDHDYDADDLDYDKSGLFLVADVEDRSRIRVIDVVAGSPAAEAGVEIGDRLTAAAGEPLGELPLERVRRLLRGPAGREVELAFERGGETVRVVVRLRRVV